MMGGRFCSTEAERDLDSEMFSPVCIEEGGAESYDGAMEPIAIVMPREGYDIALCGHNLQARNSRGKIAVLAAGAEVVLVRRLLAAAELAVDVRAVGAEAELERER